MLMNEELSSQCANSKKISCSKNLLEFAVKFFFITKANNQSFLHKKTVTEIPVARKPEFSVVVRGRQGSVRKDYVQRKPDVLFSENIQ